MFFPFSFADEEAGSIEVFLEQGAHASRECRWVYPITRAAKLDRVYEGEKVVGVHGVRCRPLLVIWRRADDTLYRYTEIRTTLKESSEYPLCIRGVCDRTGVYVSATEEM